MGADLPHCFLGPEFAVTLGAFESKMDCVVVLEEVREDLVWIRWIELDLIHCIRRRELATTLRASKTVSRVIVLNSSERVAGEEGKHKPESFPPGSRTPNCIQDIRNDDLCCSAADTSVEDCGTQGT